MSLPQFRITASISGITNRISGSMHRTMHGTVVRSVQQHGELHIAGKWNR